MRMNKKIKEGVFNVLMVLIQSLGVIGILFLVYGFLISLDKQFNREIDPYEQDVEKTDYSPYSGWTYE